MPSGLSRAVATLPGPVHASAVFLILLYFIGQGMLAAVRMRYRGGCVDVSLHF